MKTMTTRLVALAGALAIGLGAAACSKTETPPPATSSGGSSATSTSAADAESAPQASEVLEKAKANALAATSGAFAGTVDGQGKQLTIAFKGTSDGKTADISIARAGDGKARYIVADDSIYIQGDETFWKKQNAPAKVLAATDKFVKAPSGGQSVAATLTLKPFLSKIFSALTVQSVAPMATAESINGVDCWVITDTKGKAEGALYVSKDKFEVVRFTGSTGSPGQLDFSRWNEDLGITAPPASQVLTLP